MRDVLWDDVRQWFDPVGNGSAPDVIVAGTTVADWDRLLGWGAAAIVHYRHKNGSAGHVERRVYTYQGPPAAPSIRPRADEETPLSSLVRGERIAA